MRPAAARVIALAVHLGFAGAAFAGIAQSDGSVASVAPPPAAVAPPPANVAAPGEGTAGADDAYPDSGLAAPLPVEPFELLGKKVEPGARARLDLELSESFTGRAVVAPVEVIHGLGRGRVLCLTAGIHGDEIVGIEVVRRIVEHVDESVLVGTVIAVPVANPMGFRQSSRYLPDRRDLNRYFPGRPYGSSASRIAHRLFESVIRRCDLLVEFHSGSFHRANLPQTRADLSDPKLQELAQWFGAPVVVHSEGRPGTLRRAAVDEGIPALLYEAGEPMRFDEASVASGVEGTLALLARLGMQGDVPEEVLPSQVFRGSTWVRADAGGIFLAHAQLGDWVEAEQVLGAVTNPFTHERVEVRALRSGRIIGRAVDQVVTPGYALFHVGTVGLSPDSADSIEPAGADADGVEAEERPE